MAIEQDIQVKHRSGRQSNKPHKGGKKKNKKPDKGKVGVKPLTIRKKHDLKRKERKNRVQQLRKAKRDAVLTQKRGLGSINNAPILVAILSFDDSIDSNKFFDDLQSCDDEIVVNKNKLESYYLSHPKQKQRFTFCILNRYNLFSVMDTLKVADVLVLLHPLEAPDETTDKLLSVMIAHALPTTIHVIQGMHEINPKKKAEYRKNVLKNLETRFPGEKLHSADTRQEFQLLLRQIGYQKRKPVPFKDKRFHLLAENIKYIASDANPSNGTLKVSGFVRGEPINVNSLIHIPGWGDFQLNQIDYESDPFAASHKTIHHKSSTENFKLKDEDMSLDNVILCDKADPQEQESLQSEVVPDPMEGEQTWPTQEELFEATLKPKKSVKRVAAGVSDYQAAWIVDSEDESDEKSDNEYTSNSDNEYEDARSTISEESSFKMDEDIDDLESVTDVKDENYDKNIDLDEEKKMLVRFKEERMNEMFPDEIDTPLEVTARVRFQKYRGLKNFKNSPWDPMENLPHDYARIYRFENFKQTKKRVMNAEKEGAKPGMFVTLYIKDVPRSLYDGIEEISPLVVYGLLKHEQKMSVLNVVIRKHQSCKSSIKSKDNLIFHIGYRRFTCRPIFSEHKTGNKFKYERFLPRDAAVVASFYAPVIFPPASVVVFKQNQDGSHDLVATGSVLDVNPNQVVVKRIILSGHPYKVNRRTAVVRYMFFNKEDINWFKCIELQTKCGRRGHIRESLGTHGHMKCVFDKQLQSQDVVLMCLYKRVFPKWTYDACVPTPIKQISEKLDIDMM